MPELPAVIPAAADRFSRIVRAIETSRLSEPTPCSAYDVAGLLRHLLYWGPSMLAALTRVDPPARPEVEQEVDLGDDWKDRLVAQNEAFVAALTRPGALDGTVTFGAVLPASMMATLLLGEFVVHGWDLARAIGEPFEVEPATGDLLLAGLTATAPQARAMGVFGSEVPVAASASVLDRILGLAGRAPSWPT